MTWIFAELAGHLAPWRQALEDWDVEASQLVQEWIQQGRVETRRDSILRLLPRLFGKPVPPSVEAALRAQENFGVLSRWFDLVLEAASLEEFCAGIGVASCS